MSFIGKAKKRWLSRLSISFCRYNRASCSALLRGLGDGALYLSLRFLSAGAKSCGGTAALSSRWK